MKMDLIVYNSSQRLFLSGNLFSMHCNVFRLWPFSLSATNLSLSLTVNDRVNENSKQEFPTWCRSPAFIIHVHPQPSLSYSDREEEEKLCNLLSSEWLRGVWSRWKEYFISSWAVPHFLNTLQFSSHLHITEKCQLLNMWCIQDVKNCNRQMGAFKSSSK